MMDMPIESFRTLVEDKLGTLPHFLIYAIFEWLVIILLFVDGFLAFVSNEIARFFELRIPCLLCTRLDHVLIHRDSNFYYNDSICESHKRDISSLAYCNVHKKLSDIRTMCQGCLLSFATEKDSDFDKYKSLVGILHKDANCFVEEERKFLMKSFKSNEMESVVDERSRVIMCCSCCGEELKSRSSLKFNRSLSMVAPAPSPRAPFFPGGRNEEGANMDLPHIRYTELKLMSDTESELHEDEDAPNGIREDAKATAVPLLPDTDDIINEDATRTPSFTRGNKFFGISLSDSGQASPRWAHKGSTRKIPVDKLDLIADPTTDDGDGDMLSRLRRQIRLDRRSLMALYMELDEERSASAIAANNAMAMITRLQAEKAAVQMEALQYQRMMDEQAEYDQEALQLMKDLLFKRDEDVKALESELESYREKYGQIKKIGSEVCEVDADEDYQDMRSQALSCSVSERSDGSGGGSSRGSDCRRRMENIPVEEGNIPEESCLDFDGERSLLLGLLRNLEEKIHSPSEALDVENENDGLGQIGKENKAILTREVSMFRERLRAIEADSGFLKHAAMTLQKGGEGTKLLSEIAQHLRKLRPPVQSEDTD